MRTHNMKKIAVPAVLVGFGLSIALASACSNGGGNGGATTGTTSNTVGVTTGAMTTTSVTTSTTNAATTTNASSSTGMMFPAAPTVGAEIDRMGRPGINTALNKSFVPATDPTKTMGKDKYNQDKDPTMWKANYAAEFAANLAILDAIDGTCGNQLLAATGAPSATTYSTLAGALTDDRLYLDSSVPTCTAYLGVELKALGLSTTADCGGRGLDYKVMDATYAALSGLAAAANGITANDVTNSATFPYLAAPH